MTTASYFAREIGNPLYDAFDDGRQAHPPSGQLPVAKEDVQAVWADCLKTPRNRPGMAYVHVPFCENHCLFCGFYQNPWRPDVGAGYVDLVLEQAAQLVGQKALEGPPLRALYFGGGTPTALAATDIRRMVEGLRAILPLAPDCEITLEGRIHSFSMDKAEAAFAAGVNRISLGVQTFDTLIRRSLGRKATQEQVLDSLRRLVAYDAGAIVVDMMYGLPKQTPQSWDTDLRIVDDLGLDGVDHYGLNLIPGTPLMLSVEKGKLKPIERRELGDYYAQGAEVMSSLGWHWISTSHWQAPSLRERSIYNYGAKTGWDFFGLGAGAGGSLGGIGTYNLPMLEQYGTAVRAGRAPIMGMSRPSPLAPLLNALRAGMERGRIDPVAITAGFNASALSDNLPNAMEVLTPVLDQWQRAGLMQPQYRFGDLTVAGRFWQVQMTKRLTQLLNDTYLPPDMTPSNALGPNGAAKSLKSKGTTRNAA